MAFRSIERPSSPLFALMTASEKFEIVSSPLPHAPRALHLSHLHSISAHYLCASYSFDFAGAAPSEYIASISA